MVEGRDFYWENQYRVFTRSFHLKRNKCCRSDCRHCPYKDKKSMKEKEDLFYDMDGVMADFHGKINAMIDQHILGEWSSPLQWTLPRDGSFADGITGINGIGKKLQSLCEYATSRKDTIYIEGHPDRELLVDFFEPIPGFYRDLLPVKGAIESFKEMSEYYNVFVLSTASWGNPSCWSDKRLWVEEHLGEYGYKKLILTHHKEQFTGRALIDDRKKNGADRFKGEHIHFRTPKFPDWDTVNNYLRPK